MKPQPKLLPVTEAQRVVVAHAQPRGTETCVLASSIGRVPCEDLVANMALPPFDNSAMDGYALRCEDTLDASASAPVVLPIVGESAAGAPFAGTVQRGQAVTIMTGALMPAGTDSVVMLEDARLRNEHVHIAAPVVQGRHVRRAGEDVAAGHCVLRRGERIQWQHLGLLASLGMARLHVYRTPTVAVMATGSELVPIDAPLGAGHIHNANSLLLTTLLRQGRIPYYDVGIVPDTYETLCERLRESLSADVLLISGGVSVGAHDLVKRALRALGFEQIFWRVNMKPGKPLLFGRIGQTYVFGLPGNPVSCLAGFLAFIAPFLRHTMGEEQVTVRRLTAELTEELHLRESKMYLVTARLQDDGTPRVVTPTSRQGSGMLTSIAQANSFIMIPEGPCDMHPGDRVEVMPFAWT